MLVKLILMSMLFSNFVINTYGDSLEDLKDLFQDIHGEAHDKYVQLVPSQHDQDKKDHSNLINIKSLNLFGKPNTRQREDGYLEKFLRAETERICEETGRCGCSGPRCGNNIEDEAAKEVDELVDEINKQLATEDRKKDRDTLDDDKKENIFYRNQGDGYQKDEGIHKGKKIKLNDDVDIVVLNPNEIGDLLREQNFIDLTKNSIILETDTGKLTSGPENPDHLRELIAEIIKRATTSNKKSVSYKNTNKISPDDLFKYYETLKNQITNLFAFYIKNNQNEIPIEEHLSDNQLQLLQNLKLHYKQGNLKENKVKSEIVKVIFGKNSHTKVLPHSKNSQNIYIPKRFYDDILKTKKSLRSTQKRILPLTFQQKNRLITKDKGRIIPKLIWRRNQRQDVQDLGVPFKLEVNGLGQINPNQ